MRTTHAQVRDVHNAVDMQTVHQLFIGHELCVTFSARPISVVRGGAAGVLLRDPSPLRFDSVTHGVN